MAFILYKRATDKERMLCLSYPYRPLIEDYFPPDDPEIDFLTSLNCYKCLSKSRKYFEWDKLIEDMEEDEDAITEDNMNMSAGALFTVLYYFDCDDLNLVRLIIGLYFVSKMGRDVTMLHKEGREMRKIDDTVDGKYRKCNSKAYLKGSHREILCNFYIYNSIHLADPKLLQVLLRYGLQSLSSKDDKERYEIAKITAQKFA